MRYFSTFTGIGGLDMGLAEGGHECVGFSEIKESSVKLYLGHYPGHRNFGDITKIVPAEMPDFDVLTGGFPCQAFSIAGLQRGFKDRRGQMIFYLYDILVAKRPRYAVLENVKGLLQHDGGRTYRKVFKLLSSAGYSVRCLLLNAAHYGSAQARERLVFLCSREDFAHKVPVKTDDSKRFRDFRDYDPSHFKFLAETERNDEKIRQADPYPYAVLGGWDRVATITTGVSGGGGAQSELAAEDRAGAGRKVAAADRGRGREAAGFSGRVDRGRQRGEQVVRDRERGQLRDEPVRLRGLPQGTMAGILIKKRCHRCGAVKAKAAMYHSQLGFKALWFCRHGCKSKNGRQRLEKKKV